MSPSHAYVSVSRRALDVEDYIDIVRRHWAWIIGPLFAGFVVSVVTAFLWPDTYISRAVLRITPQQIPERLVPSNFNLQMAERINQMQQQILSVGSLSELVNRLDLYKRERSQRPMEDIVDDMRRKHIKIIVLETEQNRTGNKPASAFQISFEYSDQHKAQAVVSALITKFTEQNATVLRNQSNLTTDFFSDELNTAKANLVKTDQELASFRNRNIGRLPEQLGANLQALNSLQSQLSAATEAINRGAQEKLMLETHLQNLKSHANSLAVGVQEAEVVPKNDRLIQLNKNISDTETRLSGLREVYRENHPDVRNFQKQLEVLKKERDSLEAEEKQEQAKLKGKKTTNPLAARSLKEVEMSIANVQAQIQANNLDREARVKQQAKLNQAIQAYQARIETSPTSEQRYAALLQDYNLAKSKYEELVQKKAQSQMANNLEDRKAGENLEVLDPASLPQKPTEPNRWIIIGVGTALGLVLGIFLAGAREMKDTSLKNLKDVRAYTNLTVLSSIPLLENHLLVRRKRRLAWLSWSSAVITGVVAICGSMYYYYFGRS